MSDESSPCATCGAPLPAGETACPECKTHVLETSQVAGAPSISGYRVLHLLGEGGMGAVYLAEDETLGRKVAIKVISGQFAKDEASRVRFLREARSLATVEHAHVVRVYSFGEMEGDAYLILEYVEGETLAERIRREKKLSFESALQLVRQVIDALDVAWEQKIVHRDIKPSNILIDRRSQVRVADFGLAKLTSVDSDDPLTQAGLMLGTPYYVSPEQALGETVDFRSDIYSLGIVLYEMLTGERPFQGSAPMAIVAKHLHEPLPPLRERNPDVPAEVVDLVERMTAKDPDDRSTSYDELRERIDTILGVSPRTPSSIRTVVDREAGRKGSRAAIGAMIAGAILILAVIGLFSWKPWAESAQAPMDAGPADDLVVAVTPFYGPDEISAREGKLMAALVERSILSRLGRDRVTVLGIEETSEPVRSHDDARALGERLGANVVVWGEAFALRDETEIQPSFTLIRRERETESDAAVGERLTARDIGDGDPLDAISEQRGRTVQLEAEAPEQIEMRKTSAEGVGEVVAFLAGLHSLYGRDDPDAALAFFEQAPPSADLEYHRAQSLLMKDRGDDAVTALVEAITIDPTHAQSLARLGDIRVEEGRLQEATDYYSRAAASGHAYTTSRAFFHEGKLWTPETYRNEVLGGGDLRETATLLALDPESGKTIERHPMPGFLRSFQPDADGFAMTFFVNRTEGPTETIRYAAGAFDRPIYYGQGLLMRMHGMKAGWILAGNFIDEFGGPIDRQPARPVFRPRPNPHPDAPSTYPELEAALRNATERDPTQPWHLFFLGQTLWATERKAEAEATWRRMFETDYPGTPYNELNWMAKFFERLGQPAWADRAFERAFEKRKAMPQPIPDWITLIERVVNVSFVRLHEVNRQDAARNYQWLQRAREFGAVTENSDFLAALWARHLRREGNAEGARFEESFREGAIANPFNYSARAARVDYALYAVATFFLSFIVTAFILFYKGARRAGTAVASSTTETRGAKARRRHPARTAIITVTGASLVIFVLFMPHVPAVATAAAIVIPLTLIILAFRLVLKRLGSGPREALAAITLTERLGLAGLGLLLGLAAVGLFLQIARISAYASVPIGLSDSMGHPFVIRDFEERLERSDAPGLRYAAAVANHLGGRFERARELYATLGGDPRARAGLDAIEAGSIEVNPPNADELYRAYRSSVDFDVRMHEFFPSLRQVVWVGGAVVFLLLLLTGVSVTTLPSRAAPRLPLPGGDRKRRFSKTVALSMPGLHDLLRGSVLRGLVILPMLILVIVVAVGGWKSLPALGSPGIVTAMTLPNVFLSLSVPPEYASGVPSPTLELILAHPHAPLFWSIALFCFVAVLALHVSAIPSILRVYRKTDIESEVTLVRSGED